jgi:drug/metabolite transporter (DMT)-like permease
MHKQKNVLAYGFLTIAALFWAGNLVVGRMIHSEIPPFTLAFYRWLLVIVILLPLLFSKMLTNLTEIKKHFISLVILSFLAIVINSSFVYLGLRFTTVLNASLIFATIPLLTMVLSFLLLGDLMSHYKIVGALFSFLGAIIIILNGVPGTLLKIHYQYQDLFILIAVTAWVLFSILYKKITIPLSPLLFLLVIAILGDLMLLPCMLIEKYMGYSIHYSLMSLSGIFYAALFSSVLAITFWNIGIETVGPGVASRFFNLLPFFSVLLSVIFLGETIHTYHLLGGSFVLLDILLTCIATKFLLYTNPRTAS